MRKANLFRRSIAAALAVVTTFTSVPAPAFAQTERAGYKGEISLDPQIHYQTLEGWGSSLCWWGNVIGSAGDADFNNNGRPDREEIAELAFSPEYLNLNIVRYNVGGGDKKDSSIKRVEGRVPGWSKDMFGSDEGGDTFLEEEFYNKKAEDMNDAGQIWMLMQANKWRQPTGDIINKVFSNSPPYYMTKSGSSTGGYNSDKENLKQDCYDDFALYLARAAKWLDQNLKSEYSTGIDYIEPLNEPDTNYWINGSTKQEGCIFYPGQSQINAYKEMKKALEAENLSHIKMTGTDETSLSSAMNSFKKLDSETRGNLPVISAHTYSGSDEERVKLRNLAASYDKGLWMSEITRGGGSHSANSHNSMSETQTKWQSQGIMSDLKNMQSSAWIAWLVADSEYECIQTNSNWGLIHYVFEEDGPVKGYHDNLLNGDGSKKDGVPSYGYWAVTKQFYTMMQYSKFLKAGYTMVDIGDGNMCAAVSPDRKELVIVAQNFGSGTRKTSVDLGALSNEANVKLYRTSDAENCEETDASVTNRVLGVSLPSNSVSTYVITSSDGQPLYEEAGYKKTVDCYVEYTADTAASGASDNNKFTYNGDWHDGWNVREKYTTEKSSTAVFKFNGTQASLYGKKSSKGANLSIAVDGSQPEAVTAKAGSEARGSLIYTTPELAEGDHTITVAMAEDNSHTSSPEIVLEYAEIINGKLKAGGPRITNIAAHDGTLVVEFDPAAGTDTEYTAECGINADQMTESAQAINGRAVFSGLVNGTRYHVRVKGSDGSISLMETAVPNKPEGSLQYYVNAGTGRPYALVEDGALGRQNSITDQAYGPDMVTGRAWGYIDDKAYGHTGNDATAWDSLRYGGQDQVGKGIVYEFELDPGSYVVEVGMQDPWSNSGRKQDIVLQGEKKDTVVPTGQTVKKYITDVTDSRKLTLSVIRSSGNTDGQCDPLLNWIRIIQTGSDDLVSVEELSGYAAVRGVVPHLPQTVSGKNSNGDTVEKAVKWNVTSKTFDVEDYTTVTVTGAVEGYALDARASVLVVPENLQYFVDCNNTESPTYQKLDHVLDLINAVADQPYMEGGWGYADTYGAHNASGKDRFETGWYAYSGQTITYRVPMEAGSYDLAFGFQEWWGQDRPMKVMVSYQDENGQAVTRKLSEVRVSSGTSKAVSKAVLDLPADGLVTFEAAGSGSKDPVLSFFSIGQNLDHTSLITAINQAGALDRSGCEPDLLEALDEAVLKGHSILTGAKETQEHSAQAAKAITDAILAMNSSSDFTQEELIANDYVLYLANCGTPDSKVVPDGYRMGLMQSNVDQQYAKDSGSGSFWGYAAPDANSRLSKNGSDPADIAATCMSMGTDVTFDKEKSGLKYTFTLPEGDYEVTMGFHNPWSARNVSIQLEGNTVHTDLNLTEKKLVEKQYVQTVSDGELNVMVHSPNRTNQYGDPVVSYIIVRAMPEYSMEMLKSTVGEMALQVAAKHWGENVLTDYKKVEEGVNALILQETADTETIRTAYIQLKAAFAKLWERIPYTSFTGVDGALYYDTNGVKIQAHGGQIQKLNVDGREKYYWIGEDKTYDYRPVGGIHLYTSEDLYNWKDEGVVLRTMESMEEFETDPYFRELYGEYDQEKKEAVFLDLDKNRCVIERPKMIYNEKTGKYVIWFHADGRTPEYPDTDYAKANAGVAIADRPEGPYRLLGSSDLNYDLSGDQGYDGNHLGSVRDMNLFVDDDGSGYIIYSSQGNRTTFISRLNEEYTDLAVDRDEAVKGEHFTTNFEGWSREAPAMFQYNDKYYMVNSGCTGWSPNPAQYAVADHPLGPWTAMGDPCDGWESDTTFRTQSTCVFPVDAENGEFIYMGDRWIADDLSESRYVWLPVEFLGDNRLVLKRYSNWTLEDLKGKGLARIDTEIPRQFESLAQMKEMLPEKIDVTLSGEQMQGTAVTWDHIDESKPYLGEYTVLGTIDATGKRVSHTANIVNTKLIYFFDSGADTSEYFDLVKTAAAGIKNENADQAYTKANHGGYTGVQGVDFGIHNGQKLFDNGLWAEKNKAIEYAFDLAPGEYKAVTGYQEWWNTERGIKVTASMETEGGSKELGSGQFTLGRADKALVKELSFTVPDTTEGTAAVKIRITKSASSDPVLSFIGIVGEDVKESGCSISGTITGNGTAAEDVDVQLFEGDVSLASPSDASPSNAVKTDEAGFYGFKDLEDGVYTVRIPAQNGYEQAVEVVELCGTDLKDVDFALVKEEGKETELRIQKLPAKLKYLIGEALDPAGLKVALYRDGEEERVLADGEYTLSGLDSSKPGTRKITVTYVEEGDSQKIYKTSFEVTVHDKKQESSIKIVQKPHKLIYQPGEDLDLTGMEVRGLNLKDEGAVMLDEGEYEAEYDFTKAGTSFVTVIYRLEEETVSGAVNESDTDGENVTELKDSFAVQVLPEEEDGYYVERIQIIQNPYKMVYEVDGEFEPDGMVVEKTVKAVASASNAAYKETVPLGDLDIDQEEFTKTGKRSVTVTYYAEGKDGEEKQLTDEVTVTVTKTPTALLEGNLSAVQKKLDQALVYGAYLTAEEKQDAFINAVENAREYLDVLDGGKLSHKAYGLLLGIEDCLLDSYKHITASVQADSRFGTVWADGLALSADLSNQEPQTMQLKVRKPEETVPDEILEAVKAYTAMDISLYRDGIEIQPGLPVRIRMEIPSGLKKENLVVYHCHDGITDIIIPEVSGSQMSFIVSELSMFVAANTKEPVRHSSSRSNDAVWGPGFTTPGAWMKDDTGWWYQKKEGGYVCASWARINGVWYYFDEKGYMMTGWVSHENAWYYLNDDGSMAAGTWISWNNAWYYLKWDGSMAVNVMTPDGYVVGNDGAWKQ